MEIGNVVLTVCFCLLVEKLDLRVKRINVVVSNVGVHTRYGDKAFYHNFMSENIAILC